MKTRAAIGLACLCIATVSDSPLTRAGVAYERAGWTAGLDGRFHGVAGNVTIIDDTTLQVDSFYFDGGGISVYFYLGATDSASSFANGLQVGPQLVGPPYADESLMLTLPPGESLDGYGAISVWCVAVGVSFGSGTFRFDPADADNDVDVDLDDYALFETCMNGPGAAPASGGLTASQCLIAFDADGDDDVDARDYARFQVAFDGSGI